MTETRTYMDNTGPRQLETITACAADLISDKDFPGAARDILRRILDYYKCRRAGLFEFNWDAGVFSCICEECAHGTEPLCDSLQKVPASNAALLTSAFKKRTVLHLENGPQPGGDKESRGLLTALGVCELYAMPFYCGEELCGFLSIDGPAENRHDFSTFETLCSFVFSIMEKQRIRAETGAAIDKYKAILSNIHSGLTIIEIDRGSGLCTPKYANENYLSMLGITEREFFECYGKEPFHRLHPDDRQRVEAGFRRAFDIKEKFSSVYRIADGRDEYIWVRVSASSVPQRSGRSLFYLLYSDITEEKIREQRYNNELILREQTVDGKALYAFRFNLTMDIMETCSVSDSSPNFDKDDDLDKVLSKMMENVPSEKQRNEFIARMSWTALVDAYLGGCDSVEYECQMMRPGEAVVWVHNSVKILKQPRTGNLIAFFAGKDVTMEHVSADMLHTVAQKDYDFIIYLDVRHDGYILFSSMEINKQFKSRRSRNYEANAFEYIRKNVAEEDVSLALNCMTVKNVLAQLEKNDSYEFTLRVKGKNGELRIKKFQYLYQDRDDGIIILSSNDITDIFRQVEENQRLTDIAHRDLLTGLFNKGYFCRAMEEISRQPGEKWLFFIDIDNFKNFNDKLGHLVGDKVLRDVAAALNSVFRKNDLVGRFGGDEFLALLPDATAEQAQAKAAKICQSLKREYSNGSCTIPLTVSVGISSAKHSFTAAQMIAAADKAVYLAKKKGKNCWAFCEGTEENRQQQNVKE